MLNIDQRIKKIYLVAFICFGFIGTVLAIISFIDSSLVTGWIVGGIISLASFSLGIILINLFSSKKTKLISFWLGWARVWIQMIFHSCFFLLVIFINKWASNYSFLDGGIDALKDPINIFTYISGIGLVTISVFISGLLTTNKEEE